MVSLGPRVLRAARVFPSPPLYRRFALDTGVPCGLSYVAFADPFIPYSSTLFFFFLAEQSTLGDMNTSRFTRRRPAVGPQRAQRRIVLSSFPRNFFFPLGRLGVFFFPERNRFWFKTTFYSSSGSLVLPLKVFPSMPLLRREVFSPFPLMAGY